MPMGRFAEPPVLAPWKTTMSSAGDEGGPFSERPLQPPLQEGKASQSTGPANPCRDHSRGRAMTADRITMSVIRNGIAYAADEMSEALEHSSYSPIIREMLD